MGQMGLGYGSEFHLLRWLGRHRDEFTKRACAVAAEHRHIWKFIQWQDFKFEDDAFIPDQELLGIDFLKREDKLKVEYEFECGGYAWAKVKSKKQLVKWDVVGVADDGTYILGEAKAHTEEIIKGGGKKSDASRRQIMKAFELP